MRFLKRFLKQSTRTATRGLGRTRCLELEGLEQRALPTITVPTPGTPGVAKITGTTGPDQLLLRLQPGSPTNIQMSDNGGASFTTAALRDILEITISGLAGADTLTLDHSNGFVGKIGLLPIAFDGGPGRDTLIQQGNPNLVGLNQTYLVGSTSDAGRLDSTNGTISNSITFTQLNAILDVTTAIGLSLNLNEQANVLKVERDRPFNGLNVLKLEGVDQQGRNDAIDLVVEDRPTGDRRLDAGQSFVPITVANKTNVTVNGFGGDDLFTLDHSQTVTGLVSLTLDGGAGNDRVYSDNGPRSAVVNQVSIEKNVPDGLDDAFIEEMYISRLKRAASEQEVENWKNFLRTSSGRQEIVSRIERSVESRTRQVRGWYEQYLSRTATGGEETGWVNALAQGTTEEIILAGILGSQEYYTRSQSLSNIGGPDERFIRSLYSTLLGRQPSGAEVTTWLNELPRINRGLVGLAYMQSAEFRGRVIDAFYTTFLQRDADPGGRQSWVNTPLNLTQIREGFAGSLEFYDLNHAVATTVQVDAAGLVTFTGTSANSDDKRYFLLTPPRDGALAITVSSTNSRFAKLRVEDARGNNLFETEPSTGINSGTVLVKGGQQYFLRLRSQDRTPAGFSVALRLG